MGKPKRSTKPTTVKGKNPTPRRPPRGRILPSAEPVAVPAEPFVVYVLSDSTGNLTRHMFAAMSTQFATGAFKPEFHAFLRTPQRLDEALARIRAKPGAVAHALIPAASKQVVAAFCKSLDLPELDLTGPAVDWLSQVCGQRPREDAPALHRMDEAYRRRIGAIEYTLAHDDGLGLNTIHEADIVLAGVSRTGKTPTSIYLGQQGYRVANVALAMEVPPPKELLALPPRKVVGLLINPQQLSMIRARRESNWNMARTTYGEPGHVAREIAWARQLFARQKWPVIDVTDQAIEETAAQVMNALNLTAPPADANRGGDL